MGVRRLTSSNSALSVTAILSVPTFAFATFSGMLVQINGKAEEIPEGLSLDGLIAHFKLNPNQVVIELNLRVPDKSDYSGIEVKSGDQVEIVKFMGGG